MKIVNFRESSLSVRRGGLVADLAKNPKKPVAASGKNAHNCSVANLVSVQAERDSVRVELFER